MVQKKNQQPRKKTLKPNYVVGIGASAGGLKALQQFFANCQAETGIAFVIIQHLSPDYKSMMAELLAKYTKMPVSRAEDGIKMEANHIYLITPRKNITTLNGRLFLAEQEERQGLNLPIDNFFRSLAEDQGERAVGIILSGTGSDGTRGLRAIKAEGGTIFVQDIESAEFDGMPRCAIATGLTDFILPPDQIPKQLLQFLSHPRISLPEDSLEVIKKEEDSFSKLLAVLRKKTNVDFTYYKPTTVVRRIERRMGMSQVAGIDDYMEYIHRNPQEIHSLFKDLLIGVTKFFRDREAFQAVAEKAISEIILMAKNRNPSQLRVWNVGCSSGEEAYTVAMLIRDYLDTNNIDVDVKIFATDLDKDAIELAGAGSYPDSIAADVEVRYLSKYFDKTQEGYKIKKSIRQMVIFAVHNIISDPPFTKIDLLICRNLLIYLQPVLQRKIFQVFHFVLQQGGILFLGSSETILAVEDAFEEIDSKQRLYRHKSRGELPISRDLLQPATKDSSLSSARVAYENQPDLGFNQMNAKLRNSQEKYYHELVGKVVGTLLVVNDNRELVQSFGNSVKFLSLPSGNVTLDILAMLPRELSLAVASSMQRIRKEANQVVYNGIRIKYGQTESRVNLTVDVLTESLGNSQLLFLVRFEEVPDTLVANPGVIEDAQEYLISERIGDLEREVQFTRENLQATIEELQTTNEELQATNEELLAANEELQSTNEELQSVNEELNTVNAEYQNKVLELTELTTDMDNLMSSLDIPTMFLDKNLCIRRYSPAMTLEINLLEQDIGRPLTDLNSPLFRNLKRDALQVIKNRTPIEKTIRHKNDWFMQRLLPFINNKDGVDGVVLALVKITEQKKTELAWEMQHNLLLSVLEASPAATLMVNRQGKIIFVNQSAEKTLGFERSRLLRMQINSKKFMFRDFDNKLITPSEEPMAQIIQTEKPVEKKILTIQQDDGLRLILSVNVNPIFNKKKELDGAVFRFDTVAYEK